METNTTNNQSKTNYQNQNNAKQAKTKKPNKNIKFKKFLNQNKLIKAMFGISVIFLFFLCLLIPIGILADGEARNALLYTNIFFICISGFIALILNTILVIEMNQRKWYVYVVILFIGYISAFILSIVGCIYLLKELNHKDVLATRVTGHHWKTDISFIEDINESKKDTTEDESEEAIIVTTVLDREDEEQESNKKESKK